MPREVVELFYLQVLKRRVDVTPREWLGGHGSTGRRHVLRGLFQF